MPSCVSAILRNCYEDRTRLERLLMCILLIAAVINIVLAVHSSKMQSDFSQVSNVCTSRECLLETSNVLKHIDTETNPCDDFYQFACGGFLRDAHNDESLDVPHALRKQGDRELYEMYTSGIDVNDHKMVNVAKELFSACMNETQIARDGLEMIKTAINKAGGWPILEGSSWDETKFDWTETVYLLRKFGYYYSSLLKLSVEMDFNVDKKQPEYIFKVNFGNTEVFGDEDMRDFSYHEKTSDYDNYIEETIRTVIKAFVGKDHDVSQISGDIYQFYDKLKHLKRCSTNAASNKITLRNLQYELNAVNWLKFINNIVGPMVQINTTSSILFPPLHCMKEWLNTISNTPKRTVADYIMWKVVEAAIPYLPHIPQNPNVNNLQPKVRSEFCMKEIQKRFIPNPVKVLWTRKSLPSHTRDQIEEILINIKTELIQVVNDYKWMHGTDKEDFINKTKTIRILIGIPGNYLDDQIFNDLVVDWISIDTNTFMGLIAQANRNRQTMVFNQIMKSVSENEIETLHKDILTFDFDNIPMYFDNENILFLPTVSTKGLLYDEKKPHYFNYASLGAIFELSTGLQKTDYLQATKDALEQASNCIQKELNFTNHTQGVYQTSIVSIAAIVDKISYNAYQKLIRSRGEETKIIGIDYTPNQLFWMSSSFIYCKPINPYDDVLKNPNQFYNPKLYRDFVDGSKYINANFMEDFHCTNPKVDNKDILKACKIL